MDTWLLLAAVLAYTVSAQDITLNLYPPAEDQWYEINSDVSLMCKWEHDSAGRVQVTWKNGTNSGLRRIVENDEENSYVYKESSPPETRQQEVHDFGEDVEAGVMKEQYSELTILNISLSDSKVYFCFVEVGTGDKEDQVKFEVNLYAVPEVNVVGNVLSVDIRPPVATEEETVNATMATAVNATEEDDEYNYGDNYGTNSDDAYAADEPAETPKIIVDCEINGAFPEPTIVFNVGEGDPIEVTPTWNSGSDTEPYSGIATLELEADPKYDGKSVTCTAILKTEPESTPVPSGGTSPPIEILHEVTRVTTTIAPKIAIVGDDVQIRCDSDGNPMPSFTVETDVAEKPTFVPSSDGKIFTIPSVLKGDAGNYYCVATLPPRSGDESESGTMDSDSKEALEVQYIEEPTLSKTEGITLGLGQSMDIHCQGNGNPSPSVVWKKGGMPLNAGNTLRIDNAVYSDEDEYTCETSNAAGTMSKIIGVSVQGGCSGSFKTPVISSSSDDGSSYYVKLECEVTGQPVCTVDITSQPGFEITGTKKENGRILEFTQMPQLSSPVTFNCVAHNGVGNSNVSITIGQTSEVCCAEPTTAGLSTGAIIGIILLVLVVVIGIPVACYFVKKRNAPTKKPSDDPEEAEPEKEGLNKDASSEDSDTGSLPPPPADMDNDHRLNHGAHEMTTFSSNQ